MAECSSPSNVWRFSCGRDRSGRCKRELAGSRMISVGYGSPGCALALCRRRNIVTFVVMPTSVHLPEKLLQAVDRRAKTLRMSRNQLVVRALQRELENSEWSAGFFEKLAKTDDDNGKAVDEMMSAIRTGRRSKPARQF